MCWVFLGCSARAVFTFVGGVVAVSELAGAAFRAGVWGLRSAGSEEFGRVGICVEAEALVLRKLSWMNLGVKLSRTEAQGGSAAWKITP